MVTGHWSLVIPRSPLALLPSIDLPSGYRVESPVWLFALLLIPFAIWLRSRRSVPVLLIPFAAAWHRPSLTSLSRWPAVLACFALVALTLALARPQKIEDKREVHSQGYDIVLAIDLSGSMLAEDYERDGERINRLQAIKPVIQAFINQRTNDRIGIVIFAGRAYTLAPLTFDHAWLERQTERLRLGMIEDGTAIGDGLGVALTRLEQAKHENAGQRQGAFVVLMTDGANNKGALAPDQATEIAKSRGIPVYTIGAGRDGIVPRPVFDQDGRKTGRYQNMLSDLDEGTLRRIANNTGGRYFRADDIRTTENAFAAIDRAQKIEFQAKSYLLTSELFFWFALPGLALFALAALLMRRGCSGAVLASAPLPHQQPHPHPPDEFPLATRSLGAARPRCLAHLRPLPPASSPIRDRDFTVQNHSGPSHPFVTGHWSLVTSSEASRNLAGVFASALPPRSSPSRVRNGAASKNRSSTSPAKSSSPSIFRRA
ncbi:MAG: VWA domain-containing protein [Nibricoccus sp.]